MKRPSNPLCVAGVVLALSVALVACQGSPQDAGTKSKKLLGAEAAAELERLFAPMQAGGGTVACDVLTVRTSRALWDRFTYPVRSRVCTIEFETGIDGGGSRYTFRNKGGVAMPLKFVIGKRTFLVLGGARLEVLPGPPRFDVTAEGSVLVEETGKPMRELAVVRVENGRWSER